MKSTLNTIMLPVRGDGKGDNVLAHAAVVAKRHGARVRVVHCRPKADDLMPYGVAIPAVLRKQIEEVAERNASVTEDQMTEEFKTLAHECGLKIGDFEPGLATARFIEYEGKQVDAVRHFGRLADLICVPQPEGPSLGSNTLKAALFSSGRPVMMCPHADPMPSSIGDHVVIAWNGSLEATRAVGMSMALIRDASTVTILSSEAIDHSATAEELQRYLELKSIESRIHKFKSKRSNVGRELLAQCGEIGADLLVMGAYHDSYERETIFGGNSQAVVEHADLPVVFVH